MPSEAPELLPCPFCGGENLKVFDNGILCNNGQCCASGPDLGHCIGAMCRAEAIAAWNTRTDCISSDPRVKALIEAAKELAPMISDDMSQEEWVEPLGRLERALAAMEPRK